MSDGRFLSSCCTWCYLYQTWLIHAPSGPNTHAPSGPSTAPLLAGRSGYLHVSRRGTFGPGRILYQVQLVRDTYCNVRGLSPILQVVRDPYITIVEDYRLFVQLVRDPYTTIVEDYRLFFLRNPFPTPGIIPVKLQVFYPDVRSAVLKGLRTSICYIPPTPTADFCTVVSYW